MKGSHLLVLSFGSAQLATHPEMSLAQWLRQQGVIAQPVQSEFALVPLQSLEQISRLPQSHLVFMDTPLPLDRLVLLDLQHALVDTFASLEWHTVPLAQLEGRLYCETRDGYFTQMVCRDRSLLAEMLVCFLLSCLGTQGASTSCLVDFPPLVQEQLWHYAAHGLAPLSVRNTSNDVYLHVALGTPDRQVCRLAQSCLHVSEIQRSFTLRWSLDGWEICSAEEMNQAQE
ncbi:MAG: hypothetical protein NZ520_07060 [bacterium]|nr:hypothetical protein [bacterium]MCS7309954.1 hypothetical protein [Armatimonadota bacterium]